MNKKKVALILLIIYLFIVLISINIIYYVKADPDWYDPNWNFRKIHTINSASGAGTNYQVKIITEYEIGTDSGEKVYLNNHCKNDFGDIRFTDDDGITLIDYWLESKIDGDKATFWVEIKDDLSSSSINMYIYYGNPLASSISNGTKTFLLYDHFDTTTEQFIFTGAGTWTREVANSWLKWTAISSGSSFAYKELGLSNVATYSRFKWSDSAVFTGILDRFSDTSNAIWMVCKDSYDKLSIERVYLGSWAIIQEVAKTLTINTWYDGVFRLYNINLKGWLSGTWNNCTYSYMTTNTKHGLFTSRGTSGSYYAYFDYVYTRKYVEPEPVHGVWGFEEEYVPPQLNILANLDINWFMLFVWIGMTVFGLSNKMILSMSGIFGIIFGITYLDNNSLMGLSIITIGIYVFYEGFFD